MELPVGAKAALFFLHKNLAPNEEPPERYREEKHRIAESVIRLLEERFPGLHQQIEVVDVATPMTTLRSGIVCFEIGRSRSS